MLGEFLKNTKVILGSQSPRRKELLASLDVDFDVIVKSVDESIPNTVEVAKSAEYVALKKIQEFAIKQPVDTLVITADTVVVDSNDNVLGKPASKEEAIQILHSLSGNSHAVLTGVAIYYNGITKSFTEGTTVRFEKLDHQEIEYYVEKYKPYDKAGAYGIQEWIGRIAVSHIEGSYENVMGLPTVKVYQMIKEIL